jgi:hypothetical protein
MADRPIDVHDPSEEPPVQIRSELLWRLSVRLFREHVAAGPICSRCAESLAPPGTGLECAWCGQPWPCSGRRLAEVGLNAAATSR